MNLVGIHGKRRKRVAGILPARSPDPVRRGRAPTRRSALAERCAEEAEQLATEHRPARLGRKLVSARLVRRRLAARLVGQCRVRNRFDLAELVGAFPRGRQGTLATGDGCGRSAPGPPRSRTDPAARSAIRQVDVESGLHQGLCPRRARERRPVHACRGLGVDGVRRTGRQPSRLGIAVADQPGQPFADARKRSPSTRPSRTSSPPMSTPSRRIPAAAAGPGTRDRRDGCTG